MRFRGDLKKQSGLKILRNDMIYLLTAIGLSPGGSITVHIYTQTIHRTTQITSNLEEYGPCPVFAKFTLAFALQLRKKHGKTSVRVQYTYYQNTHTLQNLHIRTHTHTHTNTRALACTNTHAHTHTHTQTHIHTHSHTRPYTHTHSPTYTHTHTRPYIIHAHTMQ